MSTTQNAVKQGIYDSAYGVVTRPKKGSFLKSYNLQLSYNFFKKDLYKDQCLLGFVEVVTTTYKIPSCRVVTPLYSMSRGYNYCTSKMALYFFPPGVNKLRTRQK